MSIRIFLLLLYSSLFSLRNLSGQSNYQLGLLPSFNINKSSSNDFEFNLKIESRQQLESGVLGESTKSGYDYILTDYTLVASKDVGLINTIAAGYMLRFRNNELVHRFIQQFINVKRLNALKLAHRISTDQTITPDEPTSYRLRYRLTTEIPLNGISADVGEFYLKINNEYLNEFEDGDYDLEIRLIPFLGYKFTDSNKVELGVDYRLNSFLKDGTSNRFWLGMNWYLKI